MSFLNVIGVIIFSFFGHSSNAAMTFTGSIDMLETGAGGSIAFSLNPPITTCNGQVALNTQSRGFATQKALVILAKSIGKKIAVRTLDCSVSPELGGSYNSYDYINLLD